MFIGHLSGWWIVWEDMYVAHLLFAFLDPIGASAFIFISGISTSFSVNNRKKQINKSDVQELGNFKKEYYFRALLILGLALGYNLFLVIFFGDLKYFWTWFVLLTIAISLLLGWFILKIPKSIRILIVFLIWILNEILLIFLYPHQGEMNVHGVLFYFLYNSLDLDFFLGFFPFFIIGTVLGDILYEIYKEEEEKVMKLDLKKKLLIPSLISGPSLILVGIFFQLRLGDIYGHDTQLFNFPDFLIRGSFSWLLYTFGILLVLLSILIFIEEFDILKTKKPHRFLYYFSYYSLTVFISHNVLFFIFPNQFSATIIWLPIAITIIIVWFLLRSIYFSKWRDYFSIKIQIGRLSLWLTERFTRKEEMHVIVK